MTPPDERANLRDPGPDLKASRIVTDAWVRPSVGVGWPHPPRLHIFMGPRPGCTDSAQMLLPEELPGPQKLKDPPSSFLMRGRHGGQPVLSVPHVLRRSQASHHRAPAQGQTGCEEKQRPDKIGVEEGGVCASSVYTQVPLPAPQPGLGVPSLLPGPAIPPRCEFTSHRSWAT